MSIVANEGKDVLVSYNYMLRVEGVFDLPCKAVHSFTKENEFEYVQEGGLNDYVHALRKPISKPFTFTVERYVGTDPYPPLPLGGELILPVILMVAPHPNRFDVSKRTFVFTGCTVMGKTYGELNAEKSGILTETIVIGYREMLEVTIPMGLGDGAKRWAFTKDKAVKGNGARSARELDIPEDSKKSQKRYWMPGGPNPEKEGVFTQSATALDIDDYKPAQRYWTMKDRTKAAQNLADAEAAAAAGKKKDPVDPKVGEHALTVSALQYQGDKQRSQPRYWGLKQAVEKAKAANAPADAAQTTEDKTTKTTTPGARLMVESAIRNASDKTRATARKWETADDNKLGGGTGSAITNKALDRAVPKSRYWSMTFSAQHKKLDNAMKQMKDIPPTEMSKVAAAMRTVRNEADAMKGIMSQRMGTQWKASAIRNTTDSIYATPRKWETAGDNKLGSDNGSARTLDEKNKEKPKFRYWGIKQATGNAAADTAQTAATGGAQTDQKEDSGRVIISSAKQSIATKAVARKWETADDKKLGGGTASAKTNPATKAMVRKWETANDEKLGGGTASAKSGPNTKASARQWETADDKKLGGGTASAKQAPASEASARKWEIGGGTASAKQNGKDDKRATVRKWEISGGVASAKQNGKDSEKAVARKWEKADDNQLGGGAASAKTTPATKAAVRKWETTEDNKLGGGTSSAKSGPNTKASARQWETAEDNKLGGGTASAKLNGKDGEKAKARKWLMKNPGSNRSAVVESASKASARQWEKAGDNQLGGGTASANQSPNSKATARQWEKAGDNKLGGGTASANQSPNTKASARQWEKAGDNKLGGGTASANQSQSNQAKGRKWEMQGGTSSANQSPSTKAEGRKWPAVSSARKRQE